MADETRPKPLIPVPALTLAELAERTRKALEDGIPGDTPVLLYDAGSYHVGQIRSMAIGEVLAERDACGVLKLNLGDAGYVGMLTGPFEVGTVEANTLQGVRLAVYLCDWSEEWLWRRMSGRGIG